jgi:hypothetical protein
MSREDDLQDDGLRRALAHAPDHTAAPHWRLRKAILEHAHDAVAPASVKRAREPEALPWWKRLAGLGGGSRMPWNAAFATVLVATLVTVLWQREPVPGARPDGEAKVAAEAPPVEAPAAPAASAVPAPPAAEPAPPSEPAVAPSLVLPTPAAPPPPSLARRQADEAARRPLAAAEQAESKKKEARLAPPAQPAPAAPAPAVTAEASSDAAARPAPRDSLAARVRREEEGASKQAFAPPASPPAGLAAPGDAGGAAGSTRAARPASPSARTEWTEPPTFAALSQWNRITIAQRGGASRSLSRAEALDLHALLGSAAISAVGGQPLAGTPEWRVSLERNGEVLAVLEVARGQVRWREGRAPPATGAPSGPALAALNEALRNAVQSPEAAAQPEPSPAAPR